MYQESIIDKYISVNSSPEDKLLADLYRQTHVKILQPRMVSGHVQGIILKMISNMIKPMSVLEIGTFTGYSAICLADGLDTNGELHTIEINDELEEFASSYFARCKNGDKIIQHIGSALDIIPAMDKTFDLVFIDGDKRQYPEYYNLVIDRVRSGGFILSDNVLWNGKVVEELDQRDLYTKGVLDFNRMVTEDSRVENVILPVRDGIMMIRKL